MNHLRELMSADDVIGADQAPAAWLDFKRAGQRALCFWMGDVNSFANFNVVPELCRLPYDTCWFEFEVRHRDEQMGQVLVGLLASTDAAGTHCKAFTRVGRKWLFDGWWETLDLGGGTIKAYFEDELAGAALQHVHRVLLGALSALHSRNVSSVKTDPDPKLQAARARRGKAPLFSYWTLQFGASQSGGQSLGGTHASPRVHTRRIHRREYAPGKWTWVKPCVVGNRALGMVHKDYEWKGPQDGA